MASAGLRSSLTPSDLRDDIGCPLHSCWHRWGLGAPGESVSLLAANRLFFHWVVQGLVSGSNSSSFALPSRFSRGSVSQFTPPCKWEIKIFPLFANCSESCLNATKEGAEPIPVAVNSNSLICFCRSRASPKWATFVYVICCIYHHGIWALRVLSKFHWIHRVSFHCFQ